MIKRRLLTQLIVHSRVMLFTAMFCSSVSLICDVRLRGSSVKFFYKAHLRGSFSTMFLDEVFPQCSSTKFFTGAHRRCSPVTLSSHSVSFSSEMLRWLVRLTKEMLAIRQ